ncbi:DUF6461 domain-containing protein [Luedemannella flava]
MGDQEPRIGSQLLSHVRAGVGPDEVISRLGGADPVSVVSAQVARGGSEAVREWIDENGGSHPTGLDYVAVTRVGDWAMIVEDNGFLCTGDAAVRELSSAGEMVSFYYNENTTPRFFWAIDGQQVVWFDPAFPQDRYGSDPGRLDAILVELGFVLDEDEEEFDDAYDEAYKERTLALMERITGVRWDADLLASATFRCAGVGRRAVTEPWYAEVREELAAYAEDPREWFSRDVDPWRGRGVTDPRVKALGAAGMRLYDEDRELALAIAHAPADLIERMTTWAWERPFRLAGIPDEPWLTRIRERLRRAGTVTPADGRLVAERLDAYLRTALPVWQRDDPRQRTNAVGALLMPWNAQRPADNLCWMFAKAEGAGGGTWPEMFADLRRDFPDLRDIVIPPPPPLRSSVPPCAASGRPASAGRPRGAPRPGAHLGRPDPHRRTAARTRGAGTNARSGGPRPRHRRPDRRGGAADPAQDGGLGRPVLLHPVRTDRARLGRGSGDRPGARRSTAALVRRLRRGVRPLGQRSEGNHQPPRDGIVRSPGTARHRPRDPRDPRRRDGARRRPADRGHGRRPQRRRARRPRRGPGRFPRRVQPPVSEPVRR